MHRFFCTVYTIYLLTSDGEEEREKDTEIFVDSY